jgi:hypothetical protein
MNNDIPSRLRLEPSRSFFSLGFEDPGVNHREICQAFSCSLDPVDVETKQCARPIFNASRPSPRVQDCNVSWACFTDRESIVNHQKDLQQSAINVWAEAQCRER